MKHLFPLLFAPITLLAADFSLIREGKVQLRVEHTDTAAGTTRYAAQELQQTLQQMAEGAVEVAPYRAEGTSGAPRIVIGAHASLPPEVQAVLKLEGKGDEEVLVQEHEGTLWITGATDRAALYATYTLLDEAAGVRWLWPGESGKRIPRRDELIVRDAIRQAPDMPYRNLALIRKREFDEDVHVWMARNRFNMANIFPFRPDETRAQIPRLKELGFLLRMTGHSVVLPQEMLAKHPEYMALYSGERRSFSHHRPHLCWSNPDVQRELKNELGKWVDNFPEIDVASLYVSDHGYYCQCEGCVAMGPNITTRWQELSKVLIPALKEQRPDLKIWSLAYTQYRPVPETVAPYDHIQYTTSDLSYRQLLTSGSAANRKALTAIKGWQEMGINMGLRQYEMIGLRNPDPFMPLVSYMADQFAYAKANQLTSYTSEITPLGYPDTAPPEEQHWNVNRMNVYTAARAMWDSSLTADEVIRDWAAAAYDRAAPAMIRYYEAMEKAWRDSPKPIGHYYNDASTQVSGFISPTLIERAESALGEAMKLAGEIKDQGIRDQVIAAIALDERMFGVWRRLYRNASSEGDASIYRLLPRQGAESWEHATEALLTATNGKPLAVRMLRDGDALRLRWAQATPLTVRLHAVTAPGEALEVVADAEGKTTSNRLRYGQREAVKLDVVLEQPQEGVSEMTIRTSEVSDEIERFQRLYVSLHSGDSQWPVAPMAHGLLIGTERPTPRVAFLDLRPGAETSVHELLRLKGWESRRTVDQVGDVLAQSDFAVINYADGDKRRVSDAVTHEHLPAFFERGGIAMVHALHPFPVEAWLGDAGLGFERVGKEPTDALRRITQTTRPGDWLKKPNDLKFWASGVTPYFGFMPEQPERWTIFATVPMKDGREVPWLMATPIGKGWLVVTSEPMGYGGGWSIFGNRFNERLGLLIENLTQELRRMEKAPSQSTAPEEAAPASRRDASAAPGTASRRSA